MTDQVLAAVRTGPGATELRRFPMPDIDEDSTLLEVEFAGICGTDAKMYATPPFTAPVIMGHENVGVISRAGRGFTERKGVRDGDRVFVEHYVTASGATRGAHVPALEGRRIADHCDRHDTGRRPTRPGQGVRCRRGD